MKDYILSIDQSTSGTKALLFDQNGMLVARCDKAHRQIVTVDGWVEHDPCEILENTRFVARGVTEQAQVNPRLLRAAAISNQRETAMVWNRATGQPLANAVVWQCARGQGICQELEEKGCGPAIHRATGLPLSPYFSAAKIAWLLRNHPGAQASAERGELCAGTMDSWLLHRLTGRHITDLSNASRTQLFNIQTLSWDEEVCRLFNIPSCILPEFFPSDSLFGETDFGGWLAKPLPVHSVLGDSHGALFGQGCLHPGLLKATYGTGSSIMMNTGNRPVFSQNGLSTSIGYSVGGELSYVLEGNINYTGAVIGWLKDDLGLLTSAKQAGELAKQANPNDNTVLVPAFTGLGAPYWSADARALFYGMSRQTGRAELVRAAEECIAFQIAEVVHRMAEESGMAVHSLRADGGPTRDDFLMQFQSDILGAPVLTPHLEELSGAGAAYVAGIALGLYPNNLMDKIKRTEYRPSMAETRRQEKWQRWKQAVQAALPE